MEAPRKHHAVCVPVPAQGHINPMLKLAKLLHLNGFHITFVHTQFNLERLAKSRGQDSVQGLPAGFRFETIPDGLPPQNQRQVQDMPELTTRISVEGLRSFRELVARLTEDDGDVPPVSCIVSDGCMGFTLEAAQQFNIPQFFMFTPSACGLLGYLNYDELQKRGYFPLKDEKNLHDGYLDTEVDWIPAMRGIRLKDLPSLFRTTNPSHIMFHHQRVSANDAAKAKGVILNTFEDLESEVLDAIRANCPHLYPIGPLPMMLHGSNSTTQLDLIDSNLWKEDAECLKWLDKREECSVVYVNFGSLAIMTAEQLREFAWGLANSSYHFLWVIRPNMVDYEDEVVVTSSDEYVREIGERGLILGWAPQERVLGHPSVGGFLTHCGWNSALESISEGVPMACRPFFAEQQTNCFYTCKKWGVGMEIESDVRREEVEVLVRKLMGGERGKVMREKAMEWKNKAEAATSPGGSSYNSFTSLVSQMKGLKVNWSDDSQL